MNSSEKPCERVVIVHKHNNTKVARQVVAALRASRLRLPVEQIQTISPDINQNAELLVKKLRSGDAVGGIFGDGTLRHLIYALLLKNDPSLSVTPLMGGNANDLGHAIHGQKELTLAQMEQIFSTGTKLPARALTIERSFLSKTLTDIAGSHSGFGKGARAAAKINSSSYRQGKKGWRDARIVASTLYDNTHFVILDSNGQQHALSDLTVAISRVMAKHGRLPVRHGDKEFYASPTKKGRWPTFCGAIRLGLGVPPGRYESLLEFQTLSQVSCHLDGDNLPNLPADTHVKIGLTSNTYNLLTL